ncbi:hypothetical protein [Pseudogemmobacter faecipullorum]|uniref:Lipoprotein n=1 Tax=Pseudogemmobacter faecipullorum TaxID=2755041 RepID=A0ABS8CR83_9RHOB|nr:hypothetical protein [Pseudogemmobacter faecipullorum]MCB5411878.1 hypothetical protein [Pseudogemmobacter faecipullorum]
MKKLALIPLLLIAACSQPTGMTGKMSDGAPVVIQRVVHPGFLEDFTLISPEGWSCKTTLDWNKHLNTPYTTTARLPLACDNGQTGYALITVPHLRRGYVQAGQSSITFTLKNGRSGIVHY